MIRRVLGIVLVVCGLVGTAHVVRVGFGPVPDAAQQTALVAHLEHALATGSADRAQDFFPEGAYFNEVLVGLAEAGDPTLLEDARRHLAAIETPAMLGRFGSGMVPEHGAFAHGWALSLAARIAETSRSEADIAAARQRADAVAAALQGSSTGFLASYPGQSWPCDTVVAASALARTDALLPGQPYRGTLQEWSERVRTRLDPATGQFPHRVDQTGAAIEGPRGSSSSIIQVFWPDVAEHLGGPDPVLWQRYADTFVVREAGLVGVREYPRGQDAAGDVDSGPLVLGVSASASAVTLGAARRVGDAGLAASLDRECELLGLGLSIAGQRRYLFGALPVGEAFIAWGRSVTPTAGVPPTDARTPPPRWPMLALPGILVTLLGGWLLDVTLPDRRSGGAHDRRPA